MTQPEALRLADLLEKMPLGECDEQAAAELRRLSIENDALGLHLSERMKDLARAEAQRDALLEALKGLVAWADDLRRDDPVEDLRKARAAIKAVEGEQA